MPIQTILSTGRIQERSGFAGGAERDIEGLGDLARRSGQYPITRRGGITKAACLLPDCEMKKSDNACAACSCCCDWPFDFSFWMNSLTCSDSSITTTTVYLHVSNKSLAKIVSPLDLDQPKKSRKKSKPL